MDENDEKKPIVEDYFCVTESDSKVPNTPCIFPFNYKGVVYEGCPIDREDKIRRCTMGENPSWSCILIFLSSDQFKQPFQKPRPLNFRDFTDEITFVKKKLRVNKPDLNFLFIMAYLFISRLIWDTKAKYWITNVLKLKQLIFLFSENFWIFQ